MDLCGSCLSKGKDKVCAKCWALSDDVWEESELD